MLAILDILSMDAFCSSLELGKLRKDIRNPNGHVQAPFGRLLAVNLDMTMECRHRLMLVDSFVTEQVEPWWDPANGATQTHQLISHSYIDSAREAGTVSMPTCLEFSGSTLRSPAFSCAAARSSSLMSSSRGQA